MTTNAPLLCVLELLLISEDSIRRRFGDFLDGECLLQLMLLNRTIWRSLTERPDLLARLYYQRMLHLDKSMYYDFFYEQRVQQQDRNRTSTACSNVEGGFLQNMRRCGELRRQLRRNLAELLISEIEASSICDRIFHIFREPDLPLPKLRKDTIGNYCETPLQTHMALMNWEGRMPEPIQEPFLTLQKTIIEREHEILEGLKLAGEAELLQLRHRSQLITQYQATPSTFVNLLKLLACVTDNHLNSLKKLLTTQKDGLYDRFVEFNLRYNIYRYSMIQLEEQLGFLFEHFNFAFRLVLPQYDAEPPACVWRMMAKKWLAVMGCQHPINTTIYNYLLAKQRQHFLEQLSADNDVFTGDMRCRLSNSSEYSSELYKRELKHLKLDEYFESADGAVHREVLLRDYRECLMDLSLNELRVHWCGHTKHSVARPFLELEEELLKRNCEYFHHLADILTNVPLLKSVLEREVVFMGDKLRLGSLVRLIKQWEKLLSAEKERYPEHQQDCQMQYTLDDADEEIDYLNQQRQVPQQLDPEQRMFYDLTECITLEALQRLAHERLDEDSDDGRSVESYVSSEEG